jgi:hypothetical protein
MGPDAGRSRASSPPNGSDAEAIAAENRAKKLERERLRSEVRALASEAVAVLKQMVSDPDVAPAVRLRACLAILQAADAIAAEAIGPTSAEGVRAKIDHDEFIESLGG